MLHGSESGNKGQVRQAGIDKMLLYEERKNRLSCVGIHSFVCFELNIKIMRH